MVEVHFSTKIKTLQSDNGGEYTSNTFQTYLKELGIIHRRTTPDTPQQNGKAEHMNCTLVEAAKSMLHAAGMSFGFWEEAVYTTVHVRNCSPNVGKKWTKLQCSAFLR